MQKRGKSVTFCCKKKKMDWNNDAIFFIFSSRKITYINNFQFDSGAIIEPMNGSVANHIITMTTAGMIYLNSNLGIVILI